MTINLEPALLVTGRLQNEDGVIHVMAENIEGLPASELGCVIRIFIREDWE